METSIADNDQIGGTDLVRLDAMEPKQLIQVRQPISAKNNANLRDLLNKP